MKAEARRDGISVAKKSGIYTPNCQGVTVRQRAGNVYLIVDNKVAIELSTPAAVELGLALSTGYSVLEPSDYVVISINGQDFNVLPQQARKIGAAMLVKADKADDFQRGIQ